MVSSREVAERFGKQHSKILRTIDSLISEKPFLASQTFIKSSYKIDDNNKTYPEYLLNRDGFSLLVMGFTGSDALEWKLKYIEAFNKMEQAINKQNTKMLPITYKEALKQLLEQVEENEKLIEENSVLKPKANYHDDVLNKSDLINTTTVAKDAGYKSAAYLNQIMFCNKVVFKDKDGIWKPYAKYEWLITESYADYRSYKQDNTKPCLQWTEKGRKWILESCKEWEDNMNQNQI